MDQPDETATKTAEMMMQMTSDIVAAYLGNNQLATTEISPLMTEVHATLMSLGQASGGSFKRPKEPAVPISESVTPDYIVCLEDGKELKMLKRHLRAQFDMSPEEYLEKWDLPSDYPMVAPNYAARRSELAKKAGLGQAPAKTE